MTERKTKAGLAERLFHWYGLHHRRLPWRETKDPYKIWISEVMLQQTTVQAVLPYYQRWLRLFPDVGSLARAPLQKVLKTWQGLGYYERAQNLHRAARLISREFAGKIPGCLEDLRKLPGLGPYTAAAVASIAFDQPYPVLDANVRRVLARLTAFKGELGSHRNKFLLAYLAEFFPQKKAGEFNQSLMELGALICKPRRPRCLLCPVQAFCAAFRRGEQDIIPSPRKRSYQKIESVVGIIREEGKYLIQKRPSHGLLAGLWEFPGGKREDGETLEGALRREIREELGAEVKREKFLLKVNHSYTKFQVTLHAFECELKTRPRLQKDAYRWVQLKSLRHYPFPSGSAKIVNYLEKGEGAGSSKDKKYS